MTVLILDDDAEDTLIFCEAFGELFPFATCVSVNSCSKVEAVLNKLIPDIIFMDAHIFPTGGKDCMKVLDGLVERGKIKIIIYAATISPHELDEFTSLGVDDILVKASTYSELKSNLERLVVDKYNLASRL